MERIQKSFFKEKDVLPFFEQLNGLWPKRIALSWFWLAYQALENSGLTYVETDSEGMLVRERVSTLVIFYYEFCHISTMHESRNFTYLDQATIKNLKDDLTVDADERLFEVRKALIKYFGCEEKVIAELWINCLEGNNNCIIKMEDKINLFQQMNSDQYSNVNYKNVLEWFIGWPKGIEHFEGIAL